MDHLGFSHLNTPSGVENRVVVLETVLGKMVIILELIIVVVVGNIIKLIPQDQIPVC